MPAAPPQPEALLAAADSLRDARRWAEAAEAYAAYLAERPNHWQIRVQEGHCRKEAGDVGRALSLYRMAEELAPADADLKRQIGHALRLLGDGEATLAAYAAALALDPGLPGMARDLGRLRRRLHPAPRAPLSADAATPGALRQLVFDVTDLLDYIRAARTPTGIQRVQTEVVSRALCADRPGVEVLLTCFDGEEGRWLAIGRNAFLEMAALAAAGAEEDAPDWRRAVAALRPDEWPEDAPETTFRSGAVMVNMGNAWGVPDYFRGLRELRRRVALRFIPFVHDCIPLVMPEHCLELTVRLYARWFCAVATHADAVLANSQNTAADFSRLVAQVVPGAEPPATLVPLNAAMPAAGSATASLTAAARLREPRQGEPFVLFVATLESRKNHLLVFSAWLELLRRHGAARIPRLVCVGKPGWHADAALALLRNAPELARRVSVLSEVSDLALAGLYRRCLFTVYNSHYEGWGLPVTESLGHGKVPVVPRHSALEESGAPGAVFFTPRSEPELVAVLERMMLDPDFRAAQEARIGAPGMPRLRSWEEVSAQVMDAALALPPPMPGEPPLPQEKLHLPLGRPVTLGQRRHGGPSPGLALADRLRDGTGWFLAEPWGVWSREGFCQLSLPLPPEAADAPLRLYLGLRGPGRAMTLRLRVWAGGAEPGPWQALALQPGEEGSAMLRLAPPGSAARTIEVEMDSGTGAPLAPILPGDTRLAGVGVSMVMLCREDDLPSRLAQLEQAEARMRRSA
jgi:glycosyltransferase involved in cell wall biosynthesis